MKRIVKIRFDKEEYLSIKSWIKTNFKSQNQYAKYLGVSLPSLNAIIRGKKNLSEQYKNKIEASGYRFVTKEKE